jgi:photosystem II stability/assembly factor-like uncharacterized protein
MTSARGWSLLIFATLLCVALASSPAEAQWKNVAPGLVRGAELGGAMQYRDGIVWAGGDDVYRSTDSGMTWQSSGNFVNANITDIAFFDKLNGLVCTQRQGLFHTSDGGNSWQHVLTTGSYEKVSFNGSASIMHALDFSGIFYTSANGGVTWTSKDIADSIDCRSFAVAKDGTIYLQQADTAKPYKGVVLTSTDLGQTWNKTSGIMDGDCFTLAVDSCDSKRLYLVNEEIYEPTDHIAELYLSTDGGASWTITDPHASPFYSGSLATTNNAIFVGSLDSLNGMFRSIDRGQTWESMGGPGLAPDSRNIAAIDANTVLAMDGSGSIWLTTNGGGDSVQMGSSGFVYSEFPHRLFIADTLNLCDTTSLDTIEINASSCLWPNVISEQVIGPDAIDYQINQPISAPFSSLDSAVISFTPSDTGLRAATYQLTLDDGTVISIPLAGVGIATRDLSLAAASLSEKTDTIGGEVAVPITVGGLAHAETIELVLRYPLNDIEYDSSVNVAGARVDIPGEQWPGRSKLRIVGATSGAIAAYARFKVFSDTSFDPQVIFDSMNIPTALTPCEYLPPPAATATIYPLQGCGIQMLSRWVHLGQRPLFSIRPNPTSGAISITSSIDVGDVSIEVYDMLGSVCARSTASIGKNMPATLSLPLKSGIYYLRMISQSAEANYPIVIER